MQGKLIIAGIILAACGGEESIIMEKASAGILCIADDVCYPECKADPDCGDEDDDNNNADNDDGNDDNNNDSTEEWIDETTNLIWQNPVTDGTYTFEGAIVYCDTLVHEGYSNWKTPTISQLRSLVRGCQGTQTDGQCNLTDECLGIRIADNNGPCWNDSCGDCDINMAPIDRCFADEDLRGPCEYYWSSSARVDDKNFFYAWGLNFDTGYLTGPMRTELFHVRCYRD